MFFAKLTCFDSKAGSSMKTPFDCITLEVDLADSLVPQLDVRLDFKTFGIRGRFHLIRIENEHAAFSLSPRYKLAIFFYKASSIVETDLHASLHDLANRGQILCVCRNVQDILDTIVFASLAEWNVVDVCGVSSPISM